MAEQLTRADVEKVAKLARLKLTDSELDVFTTQLGQVLDYVDVLKELDTEDVVPMAHVADITNVFREDKAGTSLPRNKALANAPKTDGKYFLVPQILSGGE